MWLFDKLTACRARRIERALAKASYGPDADLLLHTPLAVALKLRRSLGVLRCEAGLRLDPLNLTGIMPAQGSRMDQPFGPA